MYGPCCPGNPTAKSLRIGNQMVGIVGLDAIIEHALGLKGASDEELKALLLSGIEEYNYVPREMEEEYASAAWEEFLRRKSNNPSCSCCEHE